MRQRRLLTILVAAMFVVIGATGAVAYLDDGDIAPEGPPMLDIETDSDGLFTDPVVAAAMGYPNYVTGATLESLNTSPINGQYHTGQKRMAATAFIGDGSVVATEAFGCLVNFSGEIQAPLELPTGSEITGLTVNYRDNTATGSLSVQLRETHVSGGSKTDVSIASGTTVDSADYQNQAISVPNHVVGVQDDFGFGNALNNSAMRIEINSTLDDPNLSFCGINVSYRVPASGADLVFTPVVPCTIFDSRTSKGGTGPFASLERRDFDVSGAIDLSGQGGPASGCGLPAWETVFLGQAAQARALAINVVAINPAGNGSVKIFAGNATEPAEGALMAYTGADTFVSSAGIVPLRTFCSTFITNTCATRSDMAVKVGAGTEVKIIVTGYYASSPNMTQ